MGAIHPKLLHREMRLLNRCAILFQFTAVTLLIMGWATVLYQSDQTKDILKKLFVFVNFILYVSTLSTCNSGESDMEYKV